MKRLLIVAHSPSINTRALSEAVQRGAEHEDIESVTCIVKTPFDAGPTDILDCDGIVLGTTENLGTMSGALKDFFDRSYYGVLEEKGGLPCALYIRAGHDGTGTRRAVESRYGTTLAVGTGPSDFSRRVARGVYQPSRRAGHDPCCWVGQRIVLTS